MPLFINEMIFIQKNNLSQTSYTVKFTNWSNSEITSAVYISQLKK